MPSFKIRLEEPIRFADTLREITIIINPHSRPVVGRITGHFRVKNSVFTEGRRENQQHFPVFGKQKDLLEEPRRVSWSLGVPDEACLPCFCAVSSAFMCYEVSVVHLGCERLLLFGFFLETLSQASEKTASQPCWLRPLLSLQQTGVTFLTEAFPAVLTYVRFFPCVKLHVVPQRARVRQQLWAECALNLGEKSKIILQKLHLTINLQLSEEKKPLQPVEVGKVLRKDFKHSQHRFSEQPGSEKADPASWRSRPLTAFQMSEHLKVKLWGW